MPRFLAATAAVLLMLGAGTAVAKTVVVQGTLVSQGLPEIDPHLVLGDTITATLTYDPTIRFKLGDTGLSIVQVTNVSVRDGAFPMPFSDINDGAPIARKDYSTACNNDPEECVTEDRLYTIYGPAILYNGSTIYGLVGQSAPSSLYGPDYTLGSYVDWTDGCFRVKSGLPYSCVSSNIAGPDGQSGPPLLVASSTFAILSPTYLSHYETQTFEGVWDFASSPLSIPEPSAWALMTLGIGAMGAVLRRRRAALA